MVADLIAKNYYIGKSIETVKFELGPATGGYYNYESNLSYTVYTTTDTIWDIVFIADHSTGQVARILIYKRHGGLTRKVLEAIINIIEANRYFK